MNHFSCRFALITGLLGGAVLNAQAQSIGIGTTAPNSKAALEIAASDKGLLIPRLDSVQRTAITAPPQGLLVYQKDGRAGLWYYEGGWQLLKAGNQADNLGNHTATQHLNLGTNQLVGNGGTSGVAISNAGAVKVAQLAGPGPGRLVTLADDGTLQTQAPPVSTTVNNPQIPVPVGAAVPTGGTFAINVAVSGARAYVVHETSRTLQAFDLREPAAPVAVGASVATGNTPRKVVVNPAGTRAYVVNRGSATLQAYDITNPAVAPVPVGATVATSSQPYDLAINAAGTRAYVVGTTLQAFDISDPAVAPVAVGAAVAISFNFALSVALNPAGTRAYVLGGTLQAFDISNPAVAPVLVGATAPLSTGFACVKVNPAGTRAYVLGSTLQAYDITNPAVAPVAVGAGAAVNNSPWEFVVDPSGARAYVISPSIIETFDFSGPSGAPVSLGTTPTGVSNCRSIALDGGGTRAYVVNTATNLLQTYAVASGPLLLTQNAQGTLGSVDPATLADNLGNHLASRNLNLNGNQLTSGGTNGISISSAGAVKVPQLAGTSPGRLVTLATDGTLQTQTPLATAAASSPQLPVPAGTAASTGGTFAINVAVSGTRAYVVHETSNTLQAFDISNGAVAPVAVGAPVATGTRPQMVVVNPAGSRAYVVNRTSGTLQAYNVSNPAVAPVPVGAAVAAPGAICLTVNAAGTRAYVVGTTLQAFDISNPAVAPVPVGAAVAISSNFALSVALNPAGTRAYVLGGTLQAFDISNPAVAPVLVGATAPLSTGFACVKVNPAGTRAYVLGSTLQAYDITNPAVAPVAVGAGAVVNNSPWEFVVDPTGTVAYVIGSSTIQTFDISNPASTLVPLGTVPSGIGNSRSIAINSAGTRAYVVGSTSNQLQAYAITGPPQLLAQNAQGLLGGVTIASLADNLGNHTATQDLNLGANQLVGNGGTMGLSISSAGVVTADNGLIVPTGGATVAGTTNVNTTGTAATSIGNSTGALSLTGPTTVTGTTNVNTTGTAATSIGNFTGALNLNGPTTVTGTTNVNTTGTAATSIGNGTGTVTLTGPLAINGSSSLTGVTSFTGQVNIAALTNVNTTGTAATNLGTGANAGAVTIGRSGGTVTVGNLGGAFSGLRLVTTDAAGNLTSRPFQTTLPFVSDGVNATLAMLVATSTASGYLTSTDWNTFNNKFTLPALTSGSVLFSNGTTLAQDNANLFWDNTNGRLGLGTSTPTQRLEVSGNAAVSGNVGIGTTAPAQKLDVVGTAVVSGNVGIGTTSPSTSLDVNGGLVVRANSTILITADNFAITVGNRSYLRLGSNSATATSRSITLDNGLQIGQMLFISNASNQLTGSGAIANGAFNIGDSGNVNLAANPRTLNPADMLTLMWDGAQWIEVSFSNN